MPLDTIALGKVVALLIFFPTFVGACLWAYWPSNREMFERCRHIPLRED